MWMSAAIQEHGAAAGHAATESEAFNAGDTIMHHIANAAEHPIIHLPKVFGIDFSITKHVFMLWLVAIIVFSVITWIVRRYLKQGPVPSGAGNWTGSYRSVHTGLHRSTECRREMGEYLGSVDSHFFCIYFFRQSDRADSHLRCFNCFKPLGVPCRAGFVPGRLLHGGTTATANYNVTAGLALITFFSIIIAGSKAHGVIQHWKNLVPHGLAWPIYILLIPIEILGMLVKPFALTMRLAANMTGGHIAILAVLSLVFMFTEMFQNAMMGIGVGFFISVPLALGISGLELIVVLVQAYVFTLLSAVFIGMVIHVHH